MIRTVFILSACISAAAFTISPSRFTQQQSSSTSLSMAGFGGGSGGAAKNKKKGGAGAKLPKLKAKSQWDRYNGDELKKKISIKVGVRIKGEEEWLEVGRVRSENDENTEVAVARQRALMAEHSKRLYPVKVPANSILEWGQYVANGEEDGEWKTVEKSAGDDAPKGIEKQIGFEGISDPNTGYYCYYHEGKLIENQQESGSDRRGGAFAAVKGK